MHDLKFPCEQLPAEASVARLLGLYPQRQEGLWMQRIRISGGRLSAPQWLAAAEAADQLTSEPLHLTTRQDLELHGLTAHAVPVAQKILADAGMTGLGVCGDTIRNVTVCPCSGVAPSSPELLGLAQRITELLQGQDGAFALPRKFKVSLSACGGSCAQPWINDLAFIAKPDGAGWRFGVVLAGSLGARPATGIGLGRDVLPSEVLPLTLAALKVFAAHGDRTNRHKARLRHVRQRLGDEAFLELVLRELGTAVSERHWPQVTLAQPVQTFAAKHLLRPADGNLTVAQAQALAKLAGRDDLRVRIANDHSVAVFAHEKAVLEEALAASDLHSLAQPSARVIACPGTRWCSRGLADTHALASAVRQRLSGAIDRDVLIALSGCPNGCAHSAVADVGAVGGQAAINGQRQDAWNVLSGGQCGRGPSLAQAVANRLTTSDAADMIVAEARRLDAMGYCPQAPDGCCRGRM